MIFFVKIFELQNKLKFQFNDKIIRFSRLNLNDSEYDTNR